MKIWMLSKFFLIAVFTTKCVKKSVHALFVPFWKKIQKSPTKREVLMNFKINITFCDKNLL